MANRYWLMKSEPSSFSIDDLKESKITLWDGVRNFQARNFMKQMEVGDQVLFYHSSAEPPAAVGTATVSGLAEPDPTAFDPDDSHFDPKSTPGKPIWFCVRIKFKSKFKRAVPLAELRTQDALQDMVLLQRGSRLSVQPVTPEEFEAVVALGAAKAD